MIIYYLMYNMSALLILPALLIVVFLAFPINPALAQSCDNLTECINETYTFATDTLNLSAYSLGEFIEVITIFISGLLVSLATLAITIGGVMYMLSGGNEQRASRAKNIVLYAILGLLIGLIASVITWVVDALYLGNAAGAGAEVDKYIRIFINAISFFFISLAVLAIMFGGIMYVLSGGDERRSSTAKNIIIYAILGMVIAGLARVIAQEVQTVYTGGNPVATRNLINNISNFFVGFLAILSALVVVIGGVMYVMSLGDEQRTSRAKRIVFFAVLGLLISGLATLISNIVRQIVSPLLPAGSPFFLGGGPGGAANTVTQLIGNIGIFVLSPLAMIAAAAIIYGGYTYITSAGEEDKARLGKRIILFTLIGIFIILAAALIVNIVVGL